MEHVLPAFLHQPLRSATLAASHAFGKVARLAIVCALSGGIAASASTAFAMTEGEVNLYRSAVKAADTGRWTEARSIVSKNGDKALSKLIEWMALTDANSAPDFGRVAAFIRQNSDWPKQDVLRNKAEAAMPSDLPAQEVLAWFASSPAKTPAGATRHIQALKSLGQADKAADLARSFWVNGSFGATEEKDFLSRFKEFIRPADHVARLDRLLWDELEGPAKRAMNRVDAGRRALADARIKLANMAPGAEGALSKVPANLQSDPGLIYERVRWRRKKDMDDGAIQLLLNAPITQVRPDKWWTERHILARRVMEKGDIALAYRLVKPHRQTEGSGFAQAEFLAGWLALRKMHNPQAAYAHFQLLYANVSTPISLSRGAYWAGRAAEQMGQAENARQWYGKAAAHSTTYYGQLAVQRMNPGAAMPIPAEPVVTAQDKASFDASELVRVVRALHRTHGANAGLTATFLRNLSSAKKSGPELALAAKLAQEMNRPEVAVTISKDAAAKGIPLTVSGYPTLPNRVKKPEPALVHALIRQESTFDAAAKSPVGARGLMQLMPATAKEVARKIGVRHADSMLSTNPDHNVRLGSAYLSELLDRFNGSYVLAVAAYNAGPGRVQQWLKTYGNLKDDSDYVIDWIETIPVYETRNYVQRVLEGAQVYRARLGQQASLRLEQDLKSTIIY